MTQSWRFYNDDITDFLDGRGVHLNALSKD